MARRKHRETAFLAITDCHFGKQTKTFDMAAAERRLSLVGERVVKMTQMLRSDYEFDKLVVAVLGDGPDGMGIYPTQAYHQDVHNPELQAAWFADRCLVPVIQALKTEYPQVDVEVVSGNHARPMRFGHEGASWDVSAYRLAARELKRKRGIRFEVEDTVPAVRILTVRGQRILLYHGHEIKSYSGIPFYGLRQRAVNWYTTDTYGPFRVMHVGHFHSFGRMQHNQITVMLNGTLVSGDEWALDALGYDSANLWHFHGISEERPITFDFGIDTLDEPAGKAV